MSDQKIVDALIARDNEVTRDFFYENCRPLFYSIIHKVFSYPVDYDEFVNEFYIHLMENDSYRLRQFRKDGSIYQWMKVVAIRYFIAKRKKMIEDESKENLVVEAEKTIMVQEEQKISAKVDIKHVLSIMPNRIHAYVIRRVVIDDAEMKTVAEELHTNVKNLYNIKRRAIISMTELALNEI